MPSKAVSFVVASFLLVTLIYSLYSIPDVFARQKVTKGPIDCGVLAINNALVRCCQTTTYSDGTEITKCTICDNTSPPSGCTKAYTVRQGSVNTTGVIAPLGPNAPVNTGTPPPVSIIKVPPGTFNPAGNATGGVIKVPPLIPTNPSNNTGGTPPPPPTGHAGPGCGPGTDNSTCSTATPNTQSTPTPTPGSNLGSLTSNGNSTGH